MKQCRIGLLVLCMAWTLPLAAQQPLSPAPGGTVERAQFTRGIDDHEPIDEVVVLSPPDNEIYFFTDLRHLQGRTITHRWQYRGQVVSQVSFEVKGPRWRVFSRKNINPDQLGEWSVTVVDDSGWPLRTELFRYEARNESLPKNDAVPETVRGLE